MRVNLRLLDPMPDRRFGQLQVSGNLADAAFPAEESCIGFRISGHCPKGAFSAQNLEASLANNKYY
jgi:hypothetical protein